MWKFLQFSRVFQMFSVLCDNLNIVLMAGFNVTLVYISINIILGSYQDLCSNWFLKNPPKYTCIDILFEKLMISWNKMFDCKFGQMVVVKLITKKEKKKKKARYCSNTPFSAWCGSCKESIAGGFWYFLEWYKELTTFLESLAMDHSICSQRWAWVQKRHPRQGAYLRKQLFIMIGESSGSSQW